MDPSCGSVVGEGEWGVDVVSREFDGQRAGCAVPVMGVGSQGLTVDRNAFGCPGVEELDGPLAVGHLAVERAGRGADPQGVSGTGLGVFDSGGGTL